MSSDCKTPIAYDFILDCLILVYATYEAGALCPFPTQFEAELGCDSPTARMHAVCWRLEGRRWLYNTLRCPFNGMSPFELCIGTTRNKVPLLGHVGRFVSHGSKCQRGAIRRNLKGEKDHALIWYVRKPEQGTR